MGGGDPRDDAHLTVTDVATVTAFYAEVFEALPVQRECLLDGRVLHAELLVGGHRLTVSEWSDRPADPGGPPAPLALTPADPDLLVRRALAAGATIEPTDGGPPTGVVFRDPAGLRWAVPGA
ncbi:VOC family protein [Micromonospora sp. NBS 11-29]|uniref:VOC family protein n=1 Tax=Micromonospora sp. NBS 11-29 TaxID=1960879 RepID=UPI000B78C4C0|nr:VOC family protein [Micromonospora sp. NBS 11-29]